MARAARRNRRTRANQRRGGRRGRNLVVSPLPAGAASLEVVHFPMFDNAVITQATTGEVRFFQDATGQNGKTLLDTNMFKAGSLPTPKVFDVRRIAVFPHMGLGNRTTAIANPAADAEPAAQIGMIAAFWTSFFRFRISEKNYIEAPPILLPGNYSIEGGQRAGDVPSGDANTGGRTFAGTVGMEWSLARRPPRLLPDQTFIASLNFPTALTIPSGGGLAFTFIVIVMMDGLLMREIQ